MINVSKDWLNCLVRGGVRVSYIYTVDETVHKIYKLPVSQGKIGGDGADTIRRSLDCTAYSRDLDLVPRDEDSIINVIGAEVQVMSGWRYPSGREDLVSCGVFRIKNCKVSRSRGQVDISISGLDRGFRVQGESDRPVGIVAGSLVTDGIKKLVRTRYPEATFDLSSEGSSQWRLPNLLYQARTDLWEEARTLANAVGMDLFFDNLGICTMQPIFTRGGDDTMILHYGGGYPAMKIDRELDTDDFYNGVVVYGTHSSNLTVMGEYWIEDPTNPMWRGGKFGAHAKIIETEKATLPEQCKAIAKAELIKLFGPCDTVQMEVVPNAAMQEGDIFRVTDSAVGASGLYYVMSFEFPLAVSDAMTVVGGRVV